MLVGRHLLGGRLQASRLLPPPLVCIVLLSIGLIAKCSVWAVQQDYDDLSGRHSERWSLEPGRGQIRRDKRATDTTTTSLPSTSSPSRSTTTAAGMSTTTPKPATTSSVRPAASSNSSTTPPSISTTPPESPSTSSKPATHSSEPPKLPSKVTTSTAKPLTTSSISPAAASNTSTTPPPKPLTSTLPPLTTSNTTTISPNSTTTSLKPSASKGNSSSATLKPSPGAKPSDISLGNTNYEARDVAVYLDSHPTHSIQDPRVYFTQSSPMIALMRMRKVVPKLPSSCRFAYIMRVFNELGRKMASRINMFKSQVLALMQKAPDGLGSKPTLGAYRDAVREVLIADVDLEAANEDSTLPTSRTVSTGNSSAPKTISLYISQDKEIATMFDASKKKASQMLAYSLFRLLSSSDGPKTKLSRNSTSPKKLHVLEAALKNGVRTMIKLMSTKNKFKPVPDAIGHMNDTLNEAMSVLRNYVGSEPSLKPADVADSRALEESPHIKTGGLSDSSGLIGPWYVYLFDDLGTCERVIRVFASLLDGIQDKGPKPRLINMYFAQVSQELGATMSSFVSLMGMTSNNETSEKVLIDYLDDKTLAKNASHILDDISRTHDIDKEKLPARCYLTGRRWRLMLKKAMRHFDGSQNTISMIVDRINQIKAIATDKKYYNSLDRLCLPRLEVGLKGWGINGEATGETDTTANRFPLRQPIERLNRDEDPFTSGIRMGYRIGFMIGYNDKRNQSLEMEARDPAHVKPNTPLGTDSGPKYAQHNSTGADENVSKKKAEVDYLARASYRQGLTAGARKALEIACREGYMSTLKVSVRAGMLLPLEAGSSLGSLKGSNFAKIAGGEAGRSFINSYLMDRDHIDEGTRSRLMDVGMTQGSLAGTHVGETVGAIVGHESALEAYRRSISGGGKVTRAKFHSDEYLAGAEVGFSHGFLEGGQVAQTSKIGSHATKFFRLVRPQFPSKVSSAFGHDPKDKTKSTTTKEPSGSRSGLIDVPRSLPTTSAIEAAAADDHWGQDLITPLTDQKITDFHKARNQTHVRGSFKGKYNVSKEIKTGLQRVSYLNITYDLEVDADGFAMGGITYLSLSGRINNASVLHGSLIAQNIIGRNKW